MAIYVEAIKRRTTATTEAERRARKKPGHCAGGAHLDNAPCPKCGLGPQDGPCPYDMGNLGTLEFAEHALSDVLALLTALSAAEGERG